VSFAIGTVQTWGAEEHSSQSKPNFNCAEAEKCLSEPKRAKKIRSSFLKI